MNLHARLSSERGKTVAKSGNDYIDISLNGAHGTEIVLLKLTPDGTGYRLSGWTHDDRNIDISISENMERKSNWCTHEKTSLSDFGKCLDCGQRVQTAKGEPGECPRCHVVHTDRAKECRWYGSGVCGNEI